MKIAGPLPKFNHGCTRMDTDTDKSSLPRTGSWPAARGSWQEKQKAPLPKSHSTFFGPSFFIFRFTTLQAKAPLPHVPGLLLLLLLHLGTFTQAQPTIQQAPGTRIEILGADQWTFDKAIAPGAQRLIGNARFKHEGAIMSCDSAYLYAEQRVEAFGRISVRQGDTLSMTGGRMTYTGKDRVATLSGDVHVVDKDMDLTTTNLIYNVADRVATYTGGGKLVSRKENNTLTSGRGSYLAGVHTFIFSDRVVLQGPDRTIASDTLHYTTTTGVAQFFGPTTITSGGTRMWCSRGTYDTRKDQGHFSKGARILLKDGQELLGDSLAYDRKLGLGEGWGHVHVVDTANDILVRGDRGQHREQSKRSIITGRAELVMMMGEDSLFLHADTLFASADSLGKRQIRGQRGVRFFKKDLQGACDTMTYFQSDSLIRFIGSPVLWSGTDQITGRTMRIKLRDGGADTLFVDHDAFLISEVDTAHYDQVTGTHMVGLFRNNTINRIEATGTCRTVYFPKELKDGVEQLMGLNRADCSRLIVHILEGVVQRITFITQPDSVLYPLALAPIEEFRLKGFAWRAAERPADRQGIFGGP